jgi:glycine/betaine/sarcosine/D-proline reductase family selenoprotein B
MCPVGDPNLSIKEERKLRRAIVEKALDALQVDTQEQQVFYSSLH